MAQGIECLANKQDTLSSKPSTAKKKKKKKAKYQDKENMLTFPKWKSLHAKKSEKH
jgi:hypothetical protein